MSRDSTDQQLLQRFVSQRDEAAFNGLLQRHAKSVWGVCLRVLRQIQDAEDAFQAVFLVLARRAASIRKGEAVGSWLYGVAYRTALQARRRAARRRATEEHVAAASPQQPPGGETAYQELHRQLDDELQRLAAKYRAPFVLCCLEGMSRAEAARELGWKEGTVSSRLAQARKLLQTRLARRGVTLTTILTAAALVQDTPAVAAPAALLQTTAGAVLAPPSAAAVSPATAALATSVSSAMAAGKLKAAVALLLALVPVVAGTSLTAFHMGPAAEDPAKAPKPMAVRAPDQFVPPAIPLLPRGEPIQALRYAPDGKVLGMARADGTIQVLDATTSEVLHVLRGHADRVTSLAFSPDGATLASCSLDQTAKLWDWAANKEKRTLRGHTGAVHALAFTPDGRTLATAGDDATIQLWGPVTGDKHATYAGHTGAIRALAFAPEGDVLASGSADRTVKVWARKTEPITLQGHEGTVRAVAFSSEGVLASASEDSTIKLWDLPAGKERLTLKGHAHEVWALAFAPSGRTLVSAGKGMTIILWDPASGMPWRNLKGHRGPVTALALHPRGDDLVSGGQDGAALRWPRAFAAFPVLPVLFRQDFRGKKLDEQFLQFTATNPDHQISQEAEGLRIRFTGENPAPTLQHIGFQSTRRIRGDFDISMSYELLQADRPAPGKRLGVSLYLTTDSPTKEAVNLARQEQASGSDYSCDTNRTNAEGKRQSLHQHIPTEARTGKLRLVRIGKVVHFLVAEEGRDAFRELHRCELGPEDVSKVRVAGVNTAGTPLEVRIHDFEVRAQDTAPRLGPRVRPDDGPPQVLPAAGPDGEGNAAREYRDEFYLPLKGEPSDPPPWKLVGPGARQYLRFEPSGVRIHLPAGSAEGHPQTGLAIPVAFQGDFELTVGFEVLQEVPERVDNAPFGTRLSLRALLDTPRRCEASVSRRIMKNGTTLLVTWVGRWNDAAGKDEQQSKAIPTRTKSGRLRLVRTGSMISSWVAEGSSRDFVLLQRYPLGEEDVKEVRLFASTGDSGAVLEVRVADLRLRGRSAQAPAAPLPAEDSPKEGPSRGWLVAALLLGLGITLAAALSFGLARRAQRRRPAIAERPSLLSLACTACGKGFKVRPELAGKRVKCSQCGKAVLVPEPGAGA